MIFGDNELKVILIIWFQHVEIRIMESFGWGWGVGRKFIAFGENAIRSSEMVYDQKRQEYFLLRDYCEFCKKQKSFFLPMCVINLSQLTLSDDKWTEEVLLNNNCSD